MKTGPNTIRDDISENQPAGEMRVDSQPFLVNLSAAAITGREEAGGEEGNSPPQDPAALAIED